MQPWGVRKTNKYIAIVISIVLSTALFLQTVPFAYAANPLLQARFDKMASAVATVKTTHLIGFTITDPAAVGSIVMEFCSNSPILADVCTAPTGFDIGSATLAAQQGETGFIVDPASTANKIILTRVLIAPSGNPATYQFDNVQNPDSAGTFYLRLSTHASIDGSGADIQFGGVALAIVAGLSIASEVPPYLKFCLSVTITGVDCSTATSFLIDVGEFSTNKVSKASWEFVVATNAGFGYNVTMTGTTLTSGNNVIPALTAQTASQSGTSQFGVNLRSNTNPSIGADPSGPGVSGAITAAYNTPNQFRFQNGDVVVVSNTADDLHKFTTSFISNISNAQPAGIYATTISYICLANF